MRFDKLHRLLFEETKQTPQYFYHVSSAQFDHFDPSKVKSGNSFYFWSSPLTEDGFGNMVYKVAIKPDARIGGSPRDFFMQNYINSDLDYDQVLEIFKQKYDVFVYDSQDYEGNSGWMLEVPKDKINFIQIIEKYEI